MSTSSVSSSTSTVASSSTTPSTLSTAGSTLTGSSSSATGVSSSTSSAMSSSSSVSSSSTDGSSSASSGVGSTSTSTASSSGATSSSTSQTVSPSTTAPGSSTSSTTGSSSATSSSGTVISSTTGVSSSASSVVSSSSTTSSQSLPSSTIQTVTSATTGPGSSFPPTTSSSSTTRSSSTSSSSATISSSPTQSVSSSATQTTSSIATTSGTFSTSVVSTSSLRTSSSSSTTSSVRVSSSSTTRGTPTTPIPQTSSSFTGCLVTTSATAAPQCGVTLPGTCADLPNTNGLLPLTGVTASCLLDLGPFGVGPVATCLLNIDILNPRGQPIADCLLRTLRGSCPGALPQPCIDLQLVNGLDLLVDLPACVAALGPYSSGATAVCLAVNSITSATTGLSIFGCLQGSFNPPPTVVTVTDPALCPPAPTPTRCATPSLPQQCLSLSTVNGLDLLVDIPACVQALGLYAVGDVATCLVTSVIDTLTSGQSIVSCLQRSLGSRCVTSLPQVCLDLSVSNDAVTADLCLTLLGPLSLGVAGSCFTSGLTSGDAIVQCLNNVLFP
ncbi:hypothetical protein CDEST_04296 [Colletotrichum destructivum]|uniref:Uncharacterized protein n=1 Tax=Colletotrichum destructivum TaxID=34406 RepID=A0AAX4I7C2_9PEZI|nr:hypothetical protein CDEST_04296 [Colletotrichum destructivum]